MMLPMSASGGRRTMVVAVALLGLFAVALATWAGLGNVDPTGAMIGGTTGLFTVLVAARAQQWQDTDVPPLADRLAREVKKRESETWRQLLGDSDRPIDLAFTFVRAPGHSADGAGAEGRLVEVAAYYRRLRPGRLVITGAPGAGKTVLALHLMLLLLADREPGEAVPVRLSLAAFDPDRHSLEQWITAHLVDAYRLRPAAAAALVSDRRVLPVLDGLDEIDPDPQPGYSSHAARALDALNAYADGVDKGQLVVTCRSTVYAALEGWYLWAQDSARIDIAPVAQDAARAFLSARATDPRRWQEVFRELQDHPAGPLASELSTPWRLTLASSVYEQRERSGGFVRDPIGLLAPELNTPGSVRDHLLHHVIPAAAQRRTPDGHFYTAENVRSWLTVLARYLHTNSATAQRLGGHQLPVTDLVLHDLWPLAGTRRARVAHTAFTVAAWLAAGALLLTVFPRAWIASVGMVVCAALFGVEAWVTVWPSPARVDGTRLRTPAGRRHFALGLTLGLVLGLVYGFGVGLTGGIVVGLTVGLMVGLSGSGMVGSGTPRRIVRDDLVSGVLFVLVMGLLIGLVYGFGIRLAGGIVAGLMVGLVVGLAGTWTGGSAAARHAVLGSHYVSVLATGLIGAMMSGPMYGLGAASGCVAGLMVNFAGGLAGLRYVALLLCARRGSAVWLPWRLGRFLDWCCEAGLIRVAGMAYQFRHRELQEFLARTTP